MCTINGTASPLFSAPFGTVMTSSVQSKQREKSDGWLYVIRWETGHCWSQETGHGQMCACCYVGIVQTSVPNWFYVWIRRKQGSGLTHKQGQCFQRRRRGLPTMTKSRSVNKDAQCAKLRRGTRSLIGNHDQRVRLTRSAQEDADKCGSDTMLITMRLNFRA